VTFDYNHQITKESQDIGSQISVDLSNQINPIKPMQGNIFLDPAIQKRHYKATPPLYTSFPLIHFFFSMDYTRLILPALPSQNHLADIRIAPISIGYQPPMKGRPAPVFSIPSRCFLIPAKRLLPT
jgi:hypothetical protein